MNILLPFLMAIIGGTAAALIKPKDNARIKMILTFSGAFLLTAVATEFLPEIYETGNSFMGLYLMLGVFIQIVLEFFSKGAEHGHLHVNKQVQTFPFLLFVSLCLHAFLEGMPLQQSDAMLYGIAIHKLPIAFIFTAFLISSQYKTYQIIAILLFFGSMSALGTILAGYSTYIQDFMHPVKAIVAGIVLHVSTTLILESSEGHKFNFTKILLMLAGAALAFVL
ncbi:MAG: ZIP family metal transporter [Nonlabens sp.]